MGAPVTLTQLIARVRFEADMVGSLRATDTDITTLLNTHWTELYDRLVQSGPPDYYKSTSTISTVSGTTQYALPGDFRSLIGVFVQDSSTRLREVNPMREGHRAAYDAPQGVYTIKLDYVPVPLLFDIAYPSTSIDGVSGWDELVVQLCARALMRRDRRDTSQFETVIGELRARVMSNAPKRDASGPKYIKDVDAADSWPLYGVVQNIDAWTLQGTYINLYQTSPVWP